MTEPTTDDRTLDDRTAAYWARRLAEAEDAGAPAPLPRDKHPGLTWADARAVARARDDLRLDAGDRPIGWKLGWTSAAMRQALGIERPNWGRLWASQLVDGELPTARLWHPKIEPELVFRAGAALRGPAVEPIDVAASGGAWALGLEVVHPRFESYDFDWLDNTADNSSGHAVAVGAFTGQLDLGDPGAVEIRFDGPGRSGTGRGDAALGSPLEAVAWLVRSLDAEGEGVASGDLVFTGGLAAPFDVEAGKRYRLEGPPLAPVELRAGP